MDRFNISCPLDAIVIVRPNITSFLLIQDNLVVFLHGFLGSSEDWIPIMKGVSGSARCISVDLPGLGESRVKSSDGEAWQPQLSIEVVANILSKTLQQVSSEKVTLVGYSMGARIALYMALKFSDKVQYKYSESRSQNGLT